MEGERSDEREGLREGGQSSSQRDEVEDDPGGVDPEDADGARPGDPLELPASLAAVAVAVAVVAAPRGLVSLVVSSERTHGELGRGRGFRHHLAHRAGAGRGEAGRGGRS